MGSIKVFTHPNATSYFYVKTRSFIFSEEMPRYPTTVVRSRGHLHPLRPMMIHGQLLRSTSIKPSTTHKGVYSPECNLSYATASPSTFFTGTAVAMASCSERHSAASLASSHGSDGLTAAEPLFGQQQLHLPGYSSYSSSLRL